MNPLINCVKKELQKTDFFVAWLNVGNVQELAIHFLRTATDDTVEQSNAPVNLMKVVGPSSGLSHKDSLAKHLSQENQFTERSES